ncbi:nitrogenase component 1 [Pelotomaculum propionicicum]|uniref:Nitrogenase molybdenum-iron protein alpha chain n=1 Tax=Pelotomaculum propionicicum TaxID=258475 RepID=A0A4Y7RNT5_9FIRM|nr:nitrogenase component 1 [Pelotomaculum propionicicum]NLI12079.1 nitrogen fixation protein NifE [Peptococcaceae bacterium]TEB10399.1 Nitrogenase molybdenum-iron protein alpha chain [Pelotomaculum propionicicum]
MVISKRPVVTIKGGCSCSMPGVWRAVAHNEGAVVIYHSPKACGHVTREMNLGGYYRSVARREFVPRQYMAPLVVSGLKEEHSIFGGAEQLRQCIGYVVTRYKPAYIVIANSCVAGVIGDDVQAVAYEAGQEWKIPVMSVPCSGFLDGEYYAGFYHTGRALADRFMFPRPAMENTVTLLGDRGGPGGPDVQEMKGLLQYFGLKAHCHFPGYASLEEIQRVPASALCVPLGGRAEAFSWMRRLASDLEEMFGVPFLDHDCPVGWQGTKTWLKNMGKLLGRKSQVLLAEKEQEQRLRQQVVKSRAKIRAARVVLCIGRPLLHFQPDWVFELLAYTGVSLDGIILLRGLTGQQRDAMRRELQNNTEAPVFDQREGAAVLETADLVVTTHELAEDTKRQLFLPVLSPVGVGGLVLVMQKLARLAERPARRGGIIYGW